MLRASAEKLKLTPIAGAHAATADRDTPLGYILEVDGLCVLLDCGSDASMAATVADAAAPYADRIDAVLLSSSELSCCGGLVHLWPKLRPEVTVVATVPTAKLGLQNVVTQLSSRYSTTAMALGKLPASLTVDNAHDTFKRIREVQFGQPIVLRQLVAPEVGAATEVTVRALRAGRVCGAAAWRVTYQSDDVLYAAVGLTTHSSHGLLEIDAPRGAKVAILDAAWMEDSAVEVPGAEPVHHGNVEDRIVGVARDTFRRGGSVLIPADCFARGVELLITLQYIFQREGLTYPIVFACPKAKQIVDRLRTVPEFLADGVFAEEGDAPFHNKEVVFAHSADEVEAIEGVRCVIAHSPSMDDGMAAALLPKFLQDPYGAVILVDKPAEGTVAHRLYEAAAVAETPKTSSLANSVFQYEYSSKALLGGEDLEEHLDHLARYQEDRERAAEAAATAELAARRVALEEDSDSADEEAAAADVCAPAAADDSAVHSFQRLGNMPRVLAPAKHTAPAGSHHVRFAPTERTLARNDPRRVDNAALVWGTPLEDGELSRYRHFTAETTRGEADLEDAVVVRTVQQVDNTPAAVERATARAKVAAALYYLDFRGSTDAASARRFARNYLGTCAKMCIVRGTTAATAAVAELLQAGNPKLEVTTPAVGTAADLASAVHSYSVRLDGDLLTRIAPTLQRVATDAGSWEVAWIAGSVYQEAVGASDLVIGDARPERKRGRDDDGAEKATTKGRALPSFGPPAATSETARSVPQSLVGAGRTRHEPGSVFLGSAELPSVREALGKRRLTAEPHARAPMLLVEESMAVRRSTDGSGFALEAMATPEMFAAREALYGVFGHVL